MVARFHYDDAIYERLLADKLPPSERTDVTQHVETCDLCQAKLETLAEAGIDWQDVRRYLDRSGTSKGASDDTADFKNGNVEFLTPSQMPHSLGRFGRYEIMEILGRGGMGIVMRGYDPALDRHSAIKVLAPELAASAAARGRFSREAKSAAAVVHEHVVPIQTVDQENGLPYLVMPVLEGKSLEQRVRQQGILTATESLRIGRQIALGLAAAHAQGLVHRDVKPANILLHNGVERVVITDFGLARAIDDASLTQSGTIVGTPQYMSPEQAKGEHVDARGDLFSLGSVLYFMLSGHSPFRAETTMGVLHRIVNDTPRPLQQTNADVPPWLEQIIARLLAKDPADRYATAAEVAELLEKWLAHLQDPASEPRPSEPPEEPQAAGSGGRSRVTKIALGLLGGAAALLAGIFVVLETGKGTLTIESDQEDITVRITQGETVARQLKVTPGENIVRLAAGRYLVEIEGEHDGLTVENDRVMLARGGKEVVRIVRGGVEQRQPEVGHAADQAADEGSPPNSADAMNERLRGEWKPTVIELPSIIGEQLGSRDSVRMRIGDGELILSGDKSEIRGRLDINPEGKHLSTIKISFFGEPGNEFTQLTFSGMYLHKEDWLAIVIGKSQYGERGERLELEKDQLKYPLRWRFTREVVERRGPAVSPAADQAAEDDSPPDSADAMNDRLRGEWKSTGEIELPTAIRDRLGLRTLVRMYIGQRNFWLMRGPAKWPSSDVSRQRDLYGNLQFDPEGTGAWSRIQLELFENERTIVTLEGTAQLQGDRLTLEFTSATQPLFYEKERVLDFPLRWEFARDRHAPPLRPGGLAVFSDYPTPKFPSPQELTTTHDFHIVPIDELLPDALYDLQGTWVEARRFVGSPEGYLPVEEPIANPKKLQIHNGHFKVDWLADEPPPGSPYEPRSRHLFGRVAVNEGPLDGPGAVTFATYKMVDNFSAPDGVVIDKAFSGDYQLREARLIIDVVKADRPPEFVGHLPERWEFVRGGDSPPLRSAKPLPTETVPPEALLPVEGTWTATSEIGDAPSWQLEDELSSIRLELQENNFGLQHVDPQQKVQQQIWGKVMQSDLDSEGKNGMFDINIHEGYPGKSLRLSFQLEEDQLTIEVLSSDPPDMFGKDEKRTWTFRRGIKVPDLLEEGKFGYAERSVDTETFSAFADREENVFAIYSYQHKSWDRYRFGEGLKVQEVASELFRFEEFGEMRRDGYLGFSLSGKPVKKLVAVDTQGRFQTFPLDTPIDEELVVVVLGGGLLYYAANEHVYAFSGITGTWDALPVPGLPSVKKGDGKIETPIKNYGGRPGIVVTLPEEVAIFSAKSGKWERLSHDQAKEDPRFEDYNYDLKLFEPGLPADPAGERVDDPAPESQGATGTRSLEEAVQAFNDTHANHPIGKDQPPLTADEVVASIVWAGREMGQPEAGGEVADLLTKEVIDRQLPPGWRFEIETEFAGVDGERFQGWEITLVGGEAKGESVSHRIRRRLLHQVDDEGKPLPLPEPGKAEPGATPLAEAIAEFNRQTSAMEGTPQPPLTEEEAVAAILHWKTQRDEAPVTDQDFAALQKVAETRQLPAGMELEWSLKELQEDLLSWNLGIKTSHAAIGLRGTVIYQIRRHLVRWEPLPEHQVEIQWGPVAENGLQAGIHFRPDHFEYPMATTVQPVFFLRSTTDEKLKIAFPKTLTRADYLQIKAVDRWGGNIEIEQDSELIAPSDSLELELFTGAQYRINGLPMVLGDAERGDAEMVIRAQLGQKVHVRFVVPNFADRTAPPLETGEVVFTLTEPGTMIPKMLAR